MEHAERLKAALADRYTIESEIGSGGMATVYLAQDLKHDRKVAVKVLKPELAAVIGTERFLAEIRTTANLTHPHILPLFDSGEAGGLLYFVMPFIEGESLRDRLEREGELGVEDAVELTREIARALVFAHGQGVIHRDVKPENILLGAGQAVLADFGIAQAMAGVEGARLTGVGVSLGTPAYQSPEQATGERELDGRADQYALACVLYEMLAGRPPFLGDRVETVIRQHLAVDPQPVEELRPSVPNQVAQAVARGLAKSPADRFRDMGAFETALASVGELDGSAIAQRATRPATGPPALTPRNWSQGRWALVGMVAVAALAACYFAFLRNTGPELVANNVLVTVFENGTGDPTLDGIGEVATRLIIGQLSRMGGGTLEVQPMSKAMALSQTAADPREDSSAEGLACRQGRAVGAGVVVSGSYYSLGDSLRVETEILESRDCGTIWNLRSWTFPTQEPGPGLGGLAEHAAVAVGTHLEPTPGKSWLEEGMTPPLSFEVFQAVQAAADAMEAYDLGGAGQHLLRALELDSTFLGARIALIANYARQGTPYYPLADSQAAIAERYREGATLPEQAALDYAQAAIRGDREAAYRGARRMAMASGAVVDLISLAHEAINTNRPREVLDVYGGLDPVRTGLEEELFYWQDLSDAHYLLGEFEEALSTSKRGQETFPGSLRFVLREGHAMAALGQVGEAVALAPALEDRRGPIWTGFNLMRLGRCLLRYGHTEGGRELLQRAVALFEGLPPEDLETWGAQVDLGTALLSLGRLEEAREALSNASVLNPTNIWALTALGLVAAQLGEEDEARRMSDRIRDTAQPYGFGDYDLGRKEHLQAILAAHLGELDRAVSLLRQAYEDGLMDWVDLHTSADLAPLRGHPAFEAFISPKG